VASRKAYCRHCVERSLQRGVGRLCCAVVDAWVEVIEAEAHVKVGAKPCTPIHWTLDTGHWTLDTGHWTLES